MSAPQLFVERERVILSELVASRQQVDKVLEQQATLLALVVQLVELRPALQGKTPRLPPPPLLPVSAASLMLAMEQTWVFPACLPLACETVN